MNLIFHKIPEPEGTEPTVKHEENKNFILSIAEELNVEGLEITGVQMILVCDLKVQVNNLNVKSNFYPKQSS